MKYELTYKQLLIALRNINYYLDNTQAKESIDYRQATELKAVIEKYIRA